MQLKLATYNIHACFGTDGLCDPYRIARVIKQLDADVVALQEVEHHVIDNLDLLDFIATETNMHAVAGPTMMREQRNYGNALLSKYPIGNVEFIDLSTHGVEPRGAIYARITVNQNEIAIIATHLGLKVNERKQQIEQLLGFASLHRAEVMVLMGDFNEWAPWRNTLSPLHHFFGHIASPVTFPTRLPLLKLDRIWATPNTAIKNCDSYRSALARKASDHYPLIATLNF